MAKSYAALQALIAARHNPELSQKFKAFMAEISPEIDAEQALEEGAELIAEHKALQAGRSKGNKRYTENSEPIILATEYLESVLWIRETKESLSYLCWLKEKYPERDTISETTARAHLKKAREFHSKLS